MKHIVQFVFALFLTIWLLPACSKDVSAEPCPLEIAENAFVEGRFAKAQQISDSIIIGQSFGDLDAKGLCRLSLLFVHLAEVSADDGANTAMAVRAMDAAVKSDSDSTAAYIRRLPVDDRSRLLIVEQIAEFAKNPVHPDSIVEMPDSIL